VFVRDDPHRGGVEVPQLPRLAVRAVDNLQKRIAEHIDVPRDVVENLEERVVGIAVGVEFLASAFGFDGEMV
jgi:hypothetical protein